MSVRRARAHRPLPARQRPLEGNGGDRLHRAQVQAQRVHGGGGALPGRCQRGLVRHKQRSQGSRAAPQLPRVAMSAENCSELDEAPLDDSTHSVLPPGHKRVSGAQSVRKEPIARHTCASLAQCWGQWGRCRVPARAATCLWQPAACQGPHGDEWLSVSSHRQAAARRARRAPVAHPRPRSCGRETAGASPLRRTGA
jgi:hypothetical protein